MKRKYLNADEQNSIMCIFAIMQQLEGVRTMSGKPTGKMMWDDWFDRGVMSSEAKKNLKTAYTYLTKFKNEMAKNLDDKTVELLDKKLKKFDFRLIDDYMLRKISRDIKDSFKYVVFERDNFDDFIPEIAQINCIGCNKPYCDCHIYKAYQDALLPALGERPNCPYSSDLSEYTPEELKKYEDLKARVKSKNKFFKEGK